MTKLEMIEKGMAAHAGWKARLRSAINLGKFDGQVSTVRADSLCDFGKWLYSAELSTEEKQSEHYRAVKRLHAEFHQEAAKVVDCLTSGQKDTAEKAIGMGGTYAKASMALTEVMVKWRESLR